jgi:PAS domain S-box-containing protein
MINAITSYLNLSLEEIKNHPELLINAFDHDHSIVLWNKKCEQVFGIREQQAVGRVLGDVLPYTKKSEKMDLLERALMGNEVHVPNSKFHHHPLRYEQKLVPLRDNKGDVIGVLNIVRTFHQ